MRTALACLVRATDEYYRNSEGTGPLHWPLAIGEARAALLRVLADVGCSAEPAQHQRNTPRALTVRMDNVIWLKIRGAPVRRDAQLARLLQLWELLDTEARARVLADVEGLLASLRA